MKRFAIQVLAVLAIGACVSACGSSSGSGSTTGATAGTSGARLQARLNLAKCLRSHGINVPDPSSGGGAAGGGGFLRALRTYPQSQVQTARTACSQYIAQAFPQFNLTPAQRSAVQQQLVKFAECMRSHGINVPDPQLGANGGFGLRQAFGSVDRNSPAFKSAFNACQGLRPHFGNGAGPPAGVPGA
jgi:hypothetical protein